MFYGLCDLPWWGNVVVALVFTHITIVCVTVFLHRHQAHRALDVHPIASHFFRFWLWMTTGMVTKAWAAIHRKHHAKCETPDDPHSPQVLGLAKVLWQGAELYRREATNKETLERYGQGTPDDKMEHFYQRNSMKGIRLMLILDLLLFGVPGLAIWAVQMAWIPFFAAGVINGVGHYFGYRNFECPDAATNISPWGILIGGEELHNNHHTYPTSAKLSVKWWEFDIGWLYIRLLEMVGLAKAKRIAPEPHLIPGKKQLDVATLKAIISNRFQIMASYSKEVIGPVFDQEKRVDSLWKRAKKLFIREPILLDEGAKQHLTKLLAESKTLQVAYHFKERLQNLWAKSSLGENDLLDALQTWCQEAEGSNIAPLRNFSAYLKSFA